MEGEWILRRGVVVVSLGTWSEERLWLRCIGEESILKTDEFTVICHTVISLIKIL